MDAWKQDLQKQSEDTEKLGSPRLADSSQDKLALTQSRLMEASPEVLTLAQQRIHRSAGNLYASLTVSATTAVTDGAFYMQTHGEKAGNEQHDL